MPKINQEEYEVLKGLDDKWKWIARDKDGTLVMGAGKNERYLDGWFPPENIGDSLVVDETNAVKDVSEYGNLFQFIQWEDESPYNIQELIEEYLYDNQPKLFIDGQEQSFEFIEESEEKEVKTKREIIENIDGEINYVKEKLPKMDRKKSEGRKEWHEGYLVAMKEARNKVNQLDEPETLTPEWIDERIHDSTDEDTFGNIVRIETVPAKYLRNLLVPRQEEVDQAYKDGYEQGKQHATEKQSEETETVASVIVDFSRSVTRLKEVLNMEVEELEE